MELVSKKYRDDLDKNKKFISDRCEELVLSASIFEDFLREEFKGLNPSVDYSSERLQDAIISYFYDISRYKDFHGMLKEGKQSYINFQKIYSFTAKWLIKEKPFYLNLPDDTKSSDAEYLLYASMINEYVVLSWVKISYFAQKNMLIEIKDDEWRKLAYTFKFRGIQTSLLELFFSAKGVDSTGSQPN